MRFSPGITGRSPGGTVRADRVVVDLPLGEGLAFLFLLALGYAYLWREGAFDWFGPRK